MALVALIRVSGKRSLAQMNAFDFVITVALGASFGRVLTARDVSLAESLTAFVLLLVLQFGIVQLQRRWARFATLLNAPPILLAYRGELLRGTLAKERITEREVYGAVRKGGFGSLTEIEAVVLEADGTVAVIEIARAGDAAALSGVAPRGVAGEGP